MISDSGRASACTNFGIFFRFSRFSPFAEEGFTCLDHSAMSKKKPHPWFQCWRVGWLVLLCLIVERSMGKWKVCAGLWCCWLCFVFCVGIVYLVVVFVLVVFGGFLDVPCGHIAWKVKWRVELQVFATLILGARGRSNIFQHQKASARCLAVSILFQGGPRIGSAKRIQNRFRLEGAPAVHPSERRFGKNAGNRSRSRSLDKCQTCLSEPLQ